jgi:hypothetical protein
MPDTNDLNTILDAPPQWQLYVVIGTGVLGVLLWMLGRKLARPACAVGGLVWGGMGGFVLVQQFGLTQWLFLFVVVAGLTGCLLAWFLFRVWMGISAAIILGLAIPAAVLVWQGTPPPEPIEPAEHAHADAPPAALIDAQTLKLEGEELAKKIADDVQARLRAVYEDQAAAIRGWWERLGSGGQWTMLIAAAAGASFGLIVGLIAPYFAASIQTSLVGGLLMLFAAIHLTQSSAAGFLPTELRGRLLLLGLITLAGIGVQWTLSAKRTD